MFEKLLSVATGGLGQQLLGLVREYFPPELSAEKRMEFELEVSRIAAQREVGAAQAALEAERELTQRIAALEGTASDLKSMPVVGTLVLFLRGMQRPLIGYATVYLDFQVFSGSWSIANEVHNSAFWLINVLVLSFLFGERAVQNVAPVVVEMLKARGSAK